MAFNFDDLPEDAKRAFFAKVKPGHGKGRASEKKPRTGPSPLSRSEAARKKEVESVVRRLKKLQREEEAEARLKAALARGRGFKNVGGGAQGEEGVQRIFFPSVPPFDTSRYDYQSIPALPPPPKPVWQRRFEQLYGWAKPELQRHLPTLVEKGLNRLDKSNDPYHKWTEQVDGQEVTYVGKLPRVRDGVGGASPGIPPGSPQPRQRPLFSVDVPVWGRVDIHEVQTPQVTVPVDVDAGLRRIMEAVERAAERIRERRK